MRAENWTQEEVELDGWAIRLRSYQINDRFLTEVEAESSGIIIARGIASSREESRREALETASRRLRRTKLLDLTLGYLTVGG